VSSWRILVAAAAASAAGCGGFISYSVEAPNACVTVKGVHIPGADEYTGQFLLPSPGKPVVKQSVAVPLDASILPDPTATKVSLVSFTLDGNGTGLGFIDAMEISAAADSSATVLASYARSGDPGSTIVMQPDPQPDVTPYIGDHVLTLVGALKGTLPAHGFDADAVLCLDVLYTP
jgi:hypothetical protein